MYFFFQYCDQTLQNLNRLFFPNNYVFKPLLEPVKCNENKNLYCIGEQK